MSRQKHIKVPLPEWWQATLAIMFFILAYKIDPATAKIMITTVIDLLAKHYAS